MARINPAIKTVVFLVIGLLLSFNQRWEVNVFLLMLSLTFLLLSPGDKKKWFLILLSACLLCISFFFTSLWFGQGAQINGSSDLVKALTQTGTLSSALLLSSRVLAFAAIGLLFSFTTNPDDLVASYIQQFHLPLDYAYGILAAFHFSDNLKQEYRKVQLAYRVRNIPVHRLSLKPVFIMLIHALHWSSDIASAMQSKGFDSSCNRTTYNVTKIVILDYLFLALSGVVLFVVIWGCFN